MSVIFSLAAFCFFRRDFKQNAETKILAAPLFALAGYSFWQGLATILIQKEWLPNSAVLPYSFDLTASIWNAGKLFALAIFIKIILSANRRQIESIIGGLIFTGNVYAVFGIVRFILQAAFPSVFGRFPLPELGPGIGFGTFINQNHFAFLMLMNLGLNAGMIIGGNLKINFRRLLFILCLITLAAIILTASRGGIIISMVVIGVSVLLPADKFFGNKSGERETYPSKFGSFGKKIIALGALLAALVCGIIFIGQDRVLQRFEEIPQEFQTTTNAYGFLRIDVWQATVKMIGEQPFYGVGFGGFRFAVSEYAEISGAVAPREAHNDYLELLADGGVVAAVCLVWFLYVFSKLLIKRFSESSTPFHDAARVGAIGAFAGISVHNFFDFGLHLIGNQLFLAALISVGVHRNYAERKDHSKEFAGKSSNASFPRLLYSGFLLCAAFLSVWFGFARLENSFAKSSLNRAFAQNESAKIPFDADFYETKAFIKNSYGDFYAASEDWREAIRYRPKDFSLWLNLARIESSQNQSAAAENSFREAIRLAPHYGEPYFYYGKFLVNANRKAEGFDDLHRAFERRPPYFNDVAALAWDASKGNADELIKLLSPLNIYEKEKLAGFLLEKEAYAPLAALVCGETDATAESRDRFVHVLLEKRQYNPANRIRRRECELKKSLEKNIVDGDFETGELYEGFGFGWRVNDLPETIGISLNDEDKSHGGSSLRFIFNGSSEPSQTLLSQVIVVEKNRQYQLSFDFRTEKIITGGVPSVQLILKKHDADVVYREINLPLNQTNWIDSATQIKTDAQTEAIEIRLTRQPCQQSKCPVFGRLWLGNFVLK